MTWPPFSGAGVRQVRCKIAGLARFGASEVSEERKVHEPALPTKSQVRGGRESGS